MIELHRRPAIILITSSIRRPFLIGVPVPGAYPLEIKKIHKKTHDFRI
jgi:hypothetical protein